MIQSGFYKIKNVRFKVYATNSLLALLMICMWPIILRMRLRAGTQFKHVINHMIGLSELQSRAMITICESACVYYFVCIFNYIYSIYPKDNDTVFWIKLNPTLLPPHMIISLQETPSVSSTSNYQVTHANDAIADSEPSIKSPDTPMDI